MNRSKLFLIFAAAMATSCSRVLTPGIYRTNFNTYGSFGKTLTLSCDSSVVMNFAGDMMNDNSYGQWQTNSDTLTITFDTLNYPNSRYKDELTFLIKNKKLNRILSKEWYNELLILAADTVELPSLEKLNRQYKLSKTPTNFKGKMRRQFFKLKEQFDCEE